MRDDDPFVENLKQAARALDPSAELRREVMWVRIDAARRFRRRRRAGGWYVGAGLAASLALGIAIGRFMVAEPAQVEVADRAAAYGETPFQMAATRHLARTEALLTSFSADAQQGRTQQVSDWAQDLLTDTRLLMDSPVGTAPHLELLLEDLELVLAQIANLTQYGRDGEIELIQEGIQQNEVLLRLRTATAEPMLSGI